MNKLRLNYLENGSIKNGEDKQINGNNDHNEQHEHYEHSGNTEHLTDSYFNILKSIGEDPNRDGLLDTPERAAKAMRFFTKGYKEDLKSMLFSIKYFFNS